MTTNELYARDFVSELRFSASRSSGAGGQNVNKVNTRMELRFNVMASIRLSDEEKMLLLAKLASRINAEYELFIVSQTERTQLGNKEKVIERFHHLLARALTPQKARKPTKPSKASIEKRRQHKKLQSEKKQRRSITEL